MKKLKHKKITTVQEVWIPSLNKKKLRLFTVSIFTHGKETASETSAKHAGLGAGFASEAIKKNKKNSPAPTQ